MTGNASRYRRGRTTVNGLNSRGVGCFVELLLNYLTSYLALLI